MHRFILLGAMALALSVTGPRANAQATRPAAVEPAAAEAAPVQPVLIEPAIIEPARVQPAVPRADEGDGTVDWLLSQGQPAPAQSPASQPADTPATQAVSPFTPRQRADGQQASITFSDGRTLTGQVTTTEGKPIRIWDEAAGEYRDVPLKLIKAFDAQVLWERDQPEWKFVESGSDIKEFTGRTYPARELTYTVTLVNDQQIRGGIVAPLYFENPDGRRTLVLHKRQKGEVGQTLEELIYLKRVELADDAGTGEPQAGE